MTPSGPRGDAIRRGLRAHIPTLEIVIPCYNPTEALLDSLKRIDNAACHADISLRVNIFDDGSNPTSVYERIVLNHVEVRVFFRSYNLGETRTVNLAAAALRAEGADWMLLLHADDFLTQRWLAECYSYLKCYLPNMAPFIHPHHMGIRTEAEMTRSQLSILGRVEPVEVPPGRPGIDFVSAQWSWTPSGSLIKLSEYLNVGGFHPKLLYAADNDIIVRWLMAGYSIRVFPYVGVFKLLHPHSHTSRASKEGWDDEGWCYLMVKYANLRSQLANISEHWKWLIRNLRRLARELIDLRWDHLGPRLRGVLLVPRSLLAVYAKASRPWLPPRVVDLLQWDSPPLHPSSHS